VYVSVALRSWSKQLSLCVTRWTETDHANAQRRLESARRNQSRPAMITNRMSTHYGDVGLASVFRILRVRYARDGMYHVVSFMNNKILIKFLFMGVHRSPYDTQINMSNIGNIGRYIRISVYEGTLAYRDTHIYEFIYLYYIILYYIILYYIILYYIIYKHFKLHLITYSTLFQFAMTRY
jgi:hypothetical protein